MRGAGRPAHLFLSGNKVFPRVVVASVMCIFEKSVFALQ